MSSSSHLQFAAALAAVRQIQPVNTVRVVCRRPVYARPFCLTGLPFGTPGVIYDSLSELGFPDPELDKVLTRSTRSDACCDAYLVNNSKDVD